VPHETGLIATIAVALGFAYVGGLIAARLRLPVIVGYLLAGVAVGPFTPGFIADVHLAPQLAEIGVILLMFGVGIHFSLHELLAVRSIAIPGAVGQSFGATALAVMLALWWGWSFGAGLVLGLALSVASTVVLLRALMERQVLDSNPGRVAVGWLIVEDLFTVLALVLLPSVASQLGGQPASGAVEAGTGNPLVDLALALGKVAVLVALMFAVGARVVPWLLERTARTGSPELFTLAVLALALGIAYASAAVFGVSFALGAFLAGLVVGESDLSHQAAADNLPLRDAFSVLFFVSVGMLFDPAFLLGHPGHILAVVLLIVVGKPLLAFLIVLLLRHPLHTGLVVAAALGQIGEFSFILAGLGRSLGLLPDEGYSLILAGALISITLNPLLFRAVEPIERRLAARRPTREPAPDTRRRLPRNHAILCGYGRVGSLVGRALEARGVPYVVIEQERGQVEALEKRGILALHGDGGDRALLEQVNLPAAQLLVVAIPDPLATRHIVEEARQRNPDLPIIARTHSQEEYAHLQDRQVEAVLAEREAGLAMERLALERLEVPDERPTPAPPSKRESTG
jgi:CPA2 family monovalent cation:H+ antiporter-2